MSKNSIGSIALCVAAVGAFTLTHPAHSRPVSWNEGINGDLSGDRFNPTLLTLELGFNSIIASSVGGDLEYFTFVLPEQWQLDMVWLVAYSGSDLSFMAVQQGDTFTEPNVNPVVGNLLGWTHFGPANNTLGSDVLDDMGLGAGAMGFVPPLLEGQYTFWMQQTGATMVTYQFEFIVTPAPSAIALLTLAGVMPRRRRATP